MTYRGGGRVGGARGAKTTGCVKKAAKQDALTKALMAQDQAEVETSNSYVMKKLELKQAILKIQSKLVT